MSVIQEYLNENIILRDTNFTHRWYDAWGANVVKSIEDFVQLSFSAANLPAAYSTPSPAQAAPRSLPARKAASC